MSFTQWMQAHRRSLLFLLVVLMAAGLWASMSRPVGLFPRVNFPRVRVYLDAGDRPADRMAIEVTRPVEEAVRVVPGVLEVRSTTSRGSAEINVTFGWGQNMVEALLQVNAAMTQVASVLPKGTQVEVIRMDPTVDPVLAYSLTSRTEPPSKLRDFALYQLRPVLSRVNGVARITVQGGLTEEYRVEVDPRRLEASGMTFGDVAKAVSAANTVQAVGRMEDHDKLYLILSDTQFQTMDQIGRTVLRAGPGGILLLKDVASIRKGAEPNWTRVTADGQDAVLVNVYQQLNGNTVQIARDTKAALVAYAPHLPPDVHIANWYDQSQIILSSASTVRDAILIGGIMAAIILLIFLRNYKITLIAILTVPGVLAITVIVLAIFGMSFNIMTLGGMAAAVGLIIDDAIVMVEHIIRRMREAKGSHHGRVMHAMREFTRPLAGSSAATIIIHFAPMLFLAGVTGAFFKALSITMAGSLIISFFVAWLAVPLVADKLLDEKDSNQKEGGRISEWMHAQYGRLMQRLLSKPALILLGLVPLFALGYAGFRASGSGFMPKMDEGGFILDYLSPPGTSVTETDRLLRQVQAILQSVPEVETYSRRTGLQLGGGVTESNSGDFFIRLKPFPRRGIEEVMEDVRQRVEATVPGLEIEEAQLMEDLVGDLTAVPQPIEIKLFSDDQGRLLSLAPKVAEAIKKVPGVVDVKSGVVLAGDAISIQVDAAKAALEGVDPDTVTRLAQECLDGVVATQVQRGPKMVGVRVWIPKHARERTRDVRNLMLRAQDGHLFPLSRVAAVTRVTGQPEITRDDLKLMVAVTGRISGRDMGSTVADVKKVLGARGLIPGDVDWNLGGLYRQQQIAFKGLTLVFLAAAALLFFLLLYLFEQFRPAIAVMMTTLMSLNAVFIALWLTGTELNISSMMGMTMILGNVTEVAIFVVWEYMAAPREMENAEALISAGKGRMRAILMSTLAAILALLPLAVGHSQGAAMQKPLAITIISGLIFQLPLVFFVLPVLFSVLGVERPKGQSGTTP